MDVGTDVTGPIDGARQAAVEGRLRDRRLALRERERLEMVKGAALGWDVAAIATWCGRTEATVRRWLAAYRAGGVDALADAPRPGQEAGCEIREPGRHGGAPYKRFVRVAGRMGVDDAGEVDHVGDQWIMRLVFLL